MDERLERHLCNLHNEVFEAAESRINTECSLIICEGISQAREEHRQNSEFPHYMWGYIVSCQIYQSHRHVPSLYVRVYRYSRASSPRGYSSLIICEGISRNGNIYQRRSTFPHYMWGYINEVTVMFYVMRVPSLYVRVYRNSDFAIIPIAGSLIICEGISSISAHRSTNCAFPHYMWGYIVSQPTICKWLKVPSLYVRVYRNTFKRRQRCCRSLIICEGIS